MDVSKVLVLGAGTMGHGIAQQIASSGIEVQLRDVKKEFVNKGLSQIEKNLEYSVSKDRISESEKEEILSRINGIVDIDDIDENVDVVIEAIIEKMEIKKQVFKEIAEKVSETTYLFSNTSALSISEIFSEIDNPERTGGMHFFNPVSAMKLVEVIEGVETTQETIDFMKEFANKIGKKPVEITESPGFVVNRMLVPMINEAIYTLNEGIATAEDIDKAMKLGAGLPMGPLALGDMIGLDVCLEVMKTLHEEFGEDKYRPCPLLRKKVRAGRLGKKAGKGFYNY